jgi:hypothetical protein
MTGRGFVMPVVVLLGLAGGLIVAVAMERSSQRQTIVRRQLAEYRESHRQRGVREIVATWLRYSHEQDLAELSGGEDGGGVFSIDLGAGSSLRVSIAPAHNTARIGAIGLSRDDGAAADRAEAILRERVGQAGLRSRTRTVGPVSVHVDSAPEEVLRAVIAGVIEEPDQAEEFASSLLGAVRLEDEFDPSMINAAGDEAGLEPEARARLTGVLLAGPTLWRVRAEWHAPPLPGRRASLTEAFEGLVDLSPEAFRVRGSGHSSELFLSWERLADPG